MLPTLAAPVLQGALMGSPLGQLLVTIIVVGIVVLVGRFILSLAWKLVLIAAVVVGALWLATTFLGM